MGDQPGPDPDTLGPPAADSEILPDGEVHAEPAKHTRILAVANQKGGFGKTTTAINLGTALAAIGEHVLIIDLDPQGNASTGLGIDQRSRRLSTYDVLIGRAALYDAILPTIVPRLYLAPSTLDLTGLPPTPAENDAFLADKAPNAYEKVVDRLLASPAYGENEARYWLDAAR